MQEPNVYNVTAHSTIDGIGERVRIGSFKSRREAISVVKEIIGSRALDAHYELGMCHFLTANENVKVTW